MAEMSTDAFMRRNYRLAAEMYEKCLKDSATNVELFLGCGNSPPRVGDVVPQEKYRHLASVLIDAIIANTAGPSSCPVRGFTCRICEGILLQPVTIACGHTFCHRCLARDISRSCRQCGQKIASGCMLQTNVLMKGLSEKWWREEISAARLREQGNELCRRNEIDAALAKYGEALQIGECSDHLSLFSRLPDPASAANCIIQRPYT